MKANLNAAAGRRTMLVLAILICAAATATGVRADVNEVCAQAAARAESIHDLPPRLLASIAVTESGRWDAERRSRVAWPWTVTAAGQGRYFASKQAAIRAVEQMRRRGVTVIDVGCLQVNLHYHQDAFDSLAAAFEPALNADYAGRFVRRLRGQTGDWQQAVARYHSATPSLGQPYQRKVFAMLDAYEAESHGPPPPGEVSTRSAVWAYRDAKIAAYLAARAARRAGARQAGVADLGG